MGITIDRENFSDDDRRTFSMRLTENLQALRAVLDRPGFGRGSATIGAELELNLLDESQRPLSRNQDILSSLQKPHRVQLEIDRFNLEINAPHFPLKGRPFSALRASLEQDMSSLAVAARALGGHVAAIGILPTLRPEDLGSHALSDAPRYRALDRSLANLSRGSFPIQIDGSEPLSFEASDIATEGANTSLQIHLRVDPSAFADHYNAAQLATAAVLAASGNSPTFLGHQLWAETRIALFRQSVDDRPGHVAGDWRPARVSFGHGWVRSSASELFEECVAMHAPLLPVCGPEDPAEVVRAGKTPELSELRLHNGTVWHWNRPVYDPADGGHLRIEMRSLPAGPTVVDMVANAAFLVGLTLALVPRIPTHLSRMTFGHARQNFYAAARDGLEACLLWPTNPSDLCELSPKLWQARDLICDLLSVAKDALCTAGVESDEAEEYLSLIERRVRVGQTGTVWQLRRLNSLHRDRSRADALAMMLADYVEHSTAGQPVHSWKTT